MNREGGAGNESSRYENHKEISMQHLILLAVLLGIVLYVLIVAGCYVTLGDTGVGRPNRYLDC